MKVPNIKIGLVDDQQLFLRGLGALIDSFASFEVIVYALNGLELLKKIESLPDKPDILLIDVNMPVMDGMHTVLNIAEKYPLIRMAALSIRDDDATIINMIKAGCCSYLMKDINPEELEKGLMEIYQQGYYNADAFNINYRRLLKQNDKSTEIAFTEMEVIFLGLAASDLTYRQIASEMHRSERTIDGYREALFQKLNVLSRVGMVLEAIRKRIISFDALVK